MDPDAPANRRLVAVTSSVALLALLALGGCGGSPQDPRDLKLSETGRLGTIVDDVGSAAREAARFESMFLEGAAPPAKERSKYGPGMRFALVGEPEISGDTATFTVEVFEVDEETEKETPRGEAKWTAVQKDGWWYLKTVPLP